jgi:uncharacterized membrane protein YphA (DoxX/SURF4 family)
MTSFLPLLALCLRWIVGGVLLWAGMAKIPDPLPFVKVVEAYGILPTVLTRPFAVIVPWTEVVMGGCLLVGLWTQSSAFLALLLLVSFSFALGVNIYRGTDLSCGCFGLESSGHSLEIALLQDTFLMGGTWLLLRLRQVDTLSADYLFGKRKG